MSAVVTTFIDSRLDAAMRDIHSALWLNQEAPPGDRNFPLFADECEDLKEAAVLIGRVHRAFRSRQGMTIT